MKNIGLPSSRIMSVTLLIILVVLDTVISAQQPRRGSISGRVIADDGIPMERVSVRLAALARDAAGRFMPPQVVTPDRDGRFVFNNLLPRSYRLGATAPGYVSKMFPDIGAGYLRLGDSATLELVKGGVITGKVIDPQGEPVVLARVNAIRVRDETGKAMPAASSMVSLTDDRGIYRIYGLADGSFIVAVNLHRSAAINSLQDSNIPIFYPSSGRADAGEIRVTAGSETGGVDINYRRETGHSITGTVELSDNSISPTSLSVGLLEQSASIIVGSTPANIGTNGRQFTFRGLPDGEYVLTANGLLEANPLGPSLSSVPQRVSVRGKDVIGIKLVAIKRGGISGSVEIEPARSPLPPACKQMIGGATDEVVVSAGLIPANDSARSFSMMVGLIDRSQFTISPLLPGQYRLSFNLPGELWYPLRIVGPVAGRGTTRIVDLGANPLNVGVGETLGGIIVTLAEGAATLSGRVDNANGRARIHLIPAEPPAASQLLRYAETTTDREGRFQLRHLAPGRYYVVAVVLGDQAISPSQQPMAWEAAEREQLRRLAETAKKEIELQPCQRLVDVQISPILMKK